MILHQPTAIGVLGKVPWRDEYVHVLTHGEPFVTFEAWLVESVDWASARSGPGWPDAYANGSIHAFAFRPAGAEAAIVAGVIGPSEDSGGRKFPLVVATALRPKDDLVANPERLPLILEDCWALAGQILVDVRNAPHLDLAARLEGVRPANPNADDAIASYAEWCCSLPLIELWSLVYGEPGARVAGVALRLILEAVRPYRGEERPATPLSLRLPLGSAGGAAVCFWIDLVRRAIRWRSTVPSFFWSHDGKSGELLLHLGQPPRSTVAEMWMPSRTRDEFCDLTAPPMPEEGDSLRSLSAPLSAVLGDPTRSVVDLLSAVGHDA